MKKLSLVLAAAGMMSLAACNSTPAEQAVDNAQDNAVETIENAADALENAADSATNESVESTLENAADAAENTADNIAG